MKTQLWQAAIRRVEALVAPAVLPDLPDAELLSRFLLSQDDEVFAVLVRRHGPLVWGVCRQRLLSEADAEDAFQATFFTLSQRAKQIRKPAALGAWLHAVAGRVCRNSLRSQQRRRKHERQAANGEVDASLTQSTWNHWEAAVQEEIDRLPESLRVPFVLCILQGIRQPEAAQQLGWKLGTLSARLCKAKQALIDALSKRGLAGTAILATALGSGASFAPLSAALVQRGQNCCRVVSPLIEKLAQGASGGIMNKTKLLAIVLVCGTLTLGVGSQILSLADAQEGPRPGGSSRGDGPPPVRVGGEGPSAGGGLAIAGGGAGTIADMAFSANHPGVEYQYVPKPKSKGTKFNQEFKLLLSTHGQIGWEYVGLLPGDGDELIFKRHKSSHAAGLGGMGMSPDMGGAMIVSPPDDGRELPSPRKGGKSADRPVRGLPGGAKGGAGSSGIRPGGEAPGGGADGGAGVGSGGGAASPEEPAGGGGSDGPGAGPAEVSLGGLSGSGGLGIQVPPSLTLTKGDTRRYKISTNQEIEQVHGSDQSICEVTLDPANTRRVIIRATKSGKFVLELTDEKGNTEKVNVTVR